MLVLAGPGSGKTRVIVQRVAYLISQSIRPYNILAITFTNKAAEEMRNRLTALNIHRGTTMCTFHSLAARLLREFSAEVNLPHNFSIYDDADQKVAMRDALKACELDAQNYPPARMLNVVSKYKNDLMTPDQVTQKGEYDFRAKVMANIYKAYQQQLTDNAALDFDDLLMRLAFLLRDKPKLRNLLNNRYKYVLVDEYQDTNHCQYQIARGLSLSHDNLFVTGDPDQSIYGWRGADIGNILAFEQDYPNAKVVRLEENFRSTPQVLELADELIRTNIQRKEKNLFTSNPPGITPNLVEYYNEYEEADGLAQWIRQLRREKFDYRQIAVFYRVNSMSRVLEESLRREHIPYQIVRGIEFFKRREIKDMIAYLRLLINPSDQVSLKRIINRPARGIGNTTIDRLLAHCQSTGKDIWHVINTVDQVQTINTAAKARVRKFVDLIVNIQKQLDRPVAEIMRLVYEQSTLKNALAAERTEDPADNVGELINSAVRFDSENENPTLAEYLHLIALVSDSDAYDQQAGAVSLMTLHAAKGLEFPAVSIIGVEQGLIPHSRSVGNTDAMEEERRLLFVGITRAKQTVKLSFARNRTIQGVSLASIRSEFLRNISSSSLEYIAAEGQDMSEQKSTVDHEDYADDDPYQDAGQSQYFRRGQLVRHPSLGICKIVKAIPLKDNSKVIVQFKSGARKTLILKYAHLEPMDYPD